MSRAAVVGRSLIRQHVSSTREGGSIGGVLLVASLDKHHPDVEGERGDQQERDETACEQDQDLAALPASPRRGTASC